MAQTQAPSLDITLYPHRSLSSYGLKVVLSAVVLSNLAVAAFIIRIGGWPVFGFLGLDVALVFLAFAIDIKGDLEMTDFDGTARTQKDWAFAGNRVRATPVFQFFDLEGKPTARLTGATSGVEEFMWLGEYVVAGKYNEKDMSFAKYKRVKRGE